MDLADWPWEPLAASQSWGLSLGRAHKSATAQLSLSALRVAAPHAGVASANITPPTGDGVADRGVKVVVILSRGSASAASGLDNLSQVSQVSGGI